MKFSIALLFTLISSSYAATIAVIDSGVDYHHSQLVDKMWSGPGLNGWNFTTNSHQTFNFSQIHSYPADIGRYFVLKEREGKGSLTHEEELLLSAMVDEYQLKINSFKQYAHGTHVAGIAVKDANHKVMSLTYLQTNFSSVFKSIKSMKSNVLNKQELYDEYLEELSRVEGAKFGKVAKFLTQYPVDIANASFGISYEEAQNTADKVFREVYGKYPSHWHSHQGAINLQNLIIKRYQALLTKLQSTLFVFAAGNDGMNNDSFPHSPSNINLGNTITVAATHGTDALADFSNIGIRTVDVAAPGVSIYSAAPGAITIPMSGTSQATPFVSRIAGMIKDENSKLSPSQVKRILMETVDKKPFLSDYIKSGGIVNEGRAVRAAELSRRLSLDQAIKEARLQLPSP